MVVVVNKPLKIIFKSNTVNGYAVKITNTRLWDKLKDSPVMQIGTCGLEYISRDIIHRCCKSRISISRWSAMLRAAAVGNSQGRSRDEESVQGLGQVYNVTMEKLI